MTIERSSAGDGDLIGDNGSDIGPWPRSVAMARRGSHRSTRPYRGGRYVASLGPQGLWHRGPRLERRTSALLVAPALLQPSDASSGRSQTWNAWVATVRTCVGHVPPFRAIGDELGATTIGIMPSDTASTT